MKRTSNSLSKFAVAIAAVLAVGANSAQAVVLLSDSFDRTNSNDLNASMTGIINNTGDAFASGVYAHAYIDPNHPGAPDGAANNGGGASVTDNQLRLAVGAGTSNAYINHNFTDAAILNDGGFSVSLDLTGYGGVTSSGGVGGGFGIGMSLDEVMSTGDAQNGNIGPSPEGDSDFKIQDGLQDGSNEVSDVAVSDFWVVLRADNNLQWGTKGHNFPGSGGVFGPGHLGSLNVGQQIGTVRADVTVPDFNDGTTAAYRLFFNDALVDTGTFQWTGTNENYIGLDARHGSYVSFDNLLVESKEPPPLPTLTVNRETGNITLTNENSSTSQSLVIYSIETTDGGFDQSAWATIESQGIDTNDEWIKLTDETVAYPTDISEGTLGEYVLGPNGTATDSINLGNVWIPSPFEDLSIEVRDESGAVVPIEIVYEGNGGQPISLGDYNHNGTIDGLDWPTVRDNLISDISAMTPFERYLHGDLTGDGQVNQLDYREFKTLYEAEQGVGSFAALLAGTSVPEPSTIAILAITVVGGLVYRNSHRLVRSGLLMFAVVALLSTGVASADNLFTDTFDRADSRNIDLSKTGLSGSVAASLAADSIYSHGHVDPTNDPGPQDGDAVNGGGVQILTSELQLAVGAGTSNTYINHNFTDAAILSQGGFSVSVDIAGIVSGSTLNEHGGGFAIGMTAAEAASAGDAFSGADDAPVMTSGLNNITTIGTAVQPDIVSDFWITLRGNSTLAWGGNTGNVQGLAVGAATGTITTTFAAPSFEAGQMVAYEVFFNDVSQGSGVFRWSDDVSNFIGLDARDGQGVRFDNFAIESTTDANINMLRLVVNTASGNVSLAGGDSDNVLDFYEISSAGMGLIEGSFSGLQAAAGYPDGSVFGAGWEVNGRQTSALLSESYIGGSSLVSSGAAGALLGAIYNTGLDTRDLEFTYYDTDGVAHMGFVEYVSSTPSLPDFNGDGMVNIADYTVWRNNLGATGVGLSQGDATGDGIVDVADYNEWKANFGAMAGSVSTIGANTTVPEPGTLAILGLALTAGLIYRRAR